MQELPGKEDSVKIRPHVKPLTKPENICKFRLTLNILASTNMWQSHECGLKEKWHLLGIDDSPFLRSDRYSTIVGVLMSHDFHVDAILTERIEVDGDDSIDAIFSFLSSGYGKAANIVLSNGVTFGGFNLFDPDELYEKSGVPVISVTRKEPDRDSMIRAIEKHGRDRRKVELLQKLDPQRISIPDVGVLYANIAGIDADEASRVVGRSIFRGKIPEAIRMAHMVGSVLKKGKTHGRV